MKYTKNTHKENKKENQKKKIIFQNIGYFWNLLFNFILSSRIKIHIFVFLFHIVEIIHSCFRPRQRLPWIAAKSLNFFWYTISECFDALFGSSPILTIENISWEQTSFIYAKLPKARRISHERFVREAILLTCFLLVMAISGSERKFGDVDRTHQQLN